MRIQQVAAGAVLIALLELIAPVTVPAALAGGSFIARPVTIQLRDASVIDALRLIAEASGFNLVVAPEVHGQITISLEDVPWDAALNVILENNQLAAEREGNVLRVTTLAAFTAEKQAELAARRAARAVEPMETVVIPLSYGKPADIQKDISTTVTGNRSPATGNR